MTNHIGVNYMKRFLLIAVLGIMSLTSCTTYQYVTQVSNTNYLVGETHQTVIMELGAPNGEYSDGAGGYILSYEGNRQIFSYSRKYSRNSSSIPSLQVHFNSQGICTDVKAVNTEPVRAVNAWWTVLLVLGILIII